MASRAAQAAAPPAGGAARFETRYAAYRRAKRIYAFVFAAAFLACLIASAITAKFNLVTLIDGLPRTTEFLLKLVPQIGLATLIEDIS